MSDPMYALTIYWQHPTPAVRLMFTDRQRAENVIAELKNNERMRRIFVDDDYGNTMLIALDSVAGILLTDLQSEADGARELQLFQARTQIKLQKAADADPDIREFKQRQQLLANLSQGGNSAAFPFRQ